MSTAGAFDTRPVDDAPQDLNRMKHETTDVLKGDVTVLEADKTDCVESVDVDEEIQNVSSGENTQLREAITEPIKGNGSSTIDCKHHESIRGDKPGRSGASDDKMRTRDAAGATDDDGYGRVRAEAMAAINAVRYQCSTASMK